MQAPTFKLAVKTRRSFTIHIGDILRGAETLQLLRHHAVGEFVGIIRGNGKMPDK